MNLNDLTEEEKDLINKRLESIEALHIAYDNECYHLLTYGGYETGTFLIHILDIRISDLMKRLQKDRRE